MKQLRMEADFNRLRWRFERPVIVRCRCRFGPIVGRGGVEFARAREQRREFRGRLVVIDRHRARCADRQHQHNLQKSNARMLICASN